MRLNKKATSAIFFAISIIIFPTSFLIIFLIFKKSIYLKERFDQFETFLRNAQNIYVYCIIPFNKHIINFPILTLDLRNPSI